MAALASQMFCYLAKSPCQKRGTAARVTYVPATRERERWWVSECESVINWRIMDTLTSKHFRVEQLDGVKAAWDLTQFVFECIAVIDKSQHTHAHAHTHGVDEVQSSCTLTQINSCALTFSSALKRGYSSSSSFPQLSINCASVGNLMSALERNKCKSNNRTAQNGREHNAWLSAIDISITSASAK